MKRSFLLWTVSVLLTSCGCSGTPMQSALAPAGPQARSIFGMLHLHMWVCLTVYIVVMILLLAAVLRHRRRHQSDVPVVAPPINEEIRMGAVVGGGLVLTTAILFVFLIADFVTGRSIDSLSRADLTVRVTGHQWWWEVRYENADASKVATTANEIHIPAGQTIEFLLESNDVIHSFWVPNLHGKTDLIPGHPTHTYIRADSAGSYWGQCAEFCGYQHANMRLIVHVETEPEFKTWLAGQLQPAAEPATAGQKRGREVFLSQSCVFCHTIGGTAAHSRVGPELTHVASRERIAAGTLANNRGNLGGWVTDPQSIKPGAHMPSSQLAPEDLQALLDYLESLK
jgi:cytochrome c oxidase subunit II